MYLLTSCLAAVKNHVIRYCENVYERSGGDLFWSIKDSGEVLNKLKSRGFRATSLSACDFSTLYTILPHNLIGEGLINLIEWTFKREGSLYIACNESQAFFTSGDLDDLLNIDNPYCEGMVNRIYPPELQLNKVNTSDTEAPFLDLHLSISNGFVSSKIYDKHDEFDFDIVNFPFLDGDVPRSTSYRIYISPIIPFASNKRLTAKLLQQGYSYHKLRKTFSKFYRRHYELVSKFNVGLKTLLHQGLSETDFYGDLVYKFKTIVGRADFF